MTRASIISLPLMLLLVASSATADEIGKTAPGFSLKDQAGKSQSLEGLLEKGSVALVFHRSANW